tara:strand:- start:541 stop:723 length:183 start_codon:yes stop_codon:yes gene_type:complete
MREKRRQSSHKHNPATLILAREMAREMALFICAISRIGSPNTLSQPDPIPIQECDIPPCI